MVHESKNVKQLVKCSGILHFLSLGSQSADRHVRNNVKRQVIPMVSSKNFSAWKGSDPGKSVMVSDLPSPPFKESFHPGLCHWTRGVLEEIYNVVPEYLIVEVSINSAPGGNVRKCESDLHN